MAVARAHEAGRGNLKCPRCRLTFPAPGFARQAWGSASNSQARFPATCPHCGHADGFGPGDAVW